MHILHPVTSIEIGFANGSAVDRKIDIAINGSTEISNLSFNPAGAWTTWDTQVFSVNLNAGTNTVRATAVTTSGGPNTDQLEVIPVSVYQAEDYTAQSGCTVANNVEGYTGTGFLDYGGNGTYGEWNNVNVSSAGQYTITFRCGNGSSENRQCMLRVNSSDVGNVAFAPTGAWTTWSTQTVTVNLNVGNNTIRVTANTSNGGPNLDKFDVTE